MAYVLEALLVRLGSEVTEMPAPHVVLNADLGLVLIPITDAVRARHSAGQDALVAGFYQLTDGVARWATELSRFGQVFYVHAEFHGGTGFHAVVGWDYGQRTVDPLFTRNHPAEAETWYQTLTPDQPMAINLALRLLGVERGSSSDEFAAVELGRHRFTDEWVNQGPNL